MGMNKTQVMKWFDLYEDLVQRLDIKDSPRHIWNVDETGVMNIHKAEEAVAIVGEPAYNLTALERGETSTVLAALNAFGDIIPPMIIHKGKNVGKGWKDGAPFGTIVKASDNGWINKDLFVEFGQLFVNNLQRLGLLNGRPHLLIMDNHYSHVFNLEFLNLMKANNIHVFALPSHTTHWLQPLDRVPFGSFKRKWNEGMRLFTRKNAGRKLEKKEFFSLFTPIWQASMTVELAQAGFRATGLFPFNAKAIPEEAFAPSTITERKLDSASNSQPNMLSNIENSCLPLRSSIEQPPVPNAAMNLQLISVTESVDIINLNEMQLPDISNSSSAKLVDTANKDNINASNSNTRLDKQHEQHINTDIAGSTCLPTTDENAIVSIEQADLDVSFENLMPVPHRDRPQSSRPRKKPPSYELTSEENVAFIQERTKPITKKAAKEKETSKEKKQKKTVKQKVIKKKKESKKEKKQKEEDICKYCGFAYGEATDPFIDDEWIECDACRDWLHETCIEITVRGQLCADCVQTTTK
ncbi:uncharacterized protein LOC136089536 [Hydra vulgaris]|uniref:Uncharacterized protein LOC136089536 n=1 Tax=Hydra vulgaris TaxID=6087 RepID=A0ABM4DBA6_HYDVU